MMESRTKGCLRIAKACIKISFIGALLMVFTGCATIVKGTTQTIPVASDPDSADVTIDGVLYGQTPIDLKVKRKRNHLVTINKTGFHPKNIPITKNVGGAVWGNILAGGFIGWGVDAASGAQYNLSPEVISIKLEAITDSDEPTKNDSSGSEFVTKLNQLDSLVEGKTITKENYIAERCKLFEEYFPTTKPEEACSKEVETSEDASP
jgi:hypothetical protein